MLCSEYNLVSTGMINRDALSSMTKIQVHWRPPMPLSSPTLLSDLTPPDAENTVRDVARDSHDSSQARWKAVSMKHLKGTVA